MPNGCCSLRRKKKERNINTYWRPESAYGTSHDYKYGWIQVVHIKGKIKALGFLKIHYNYHCACGAIPLEMFCNIQILCMGWIVMRGHHIWGWFMWWSNVMSGASTSASECHANWTLWAMTSMMWWWYVYMCLISWYSMSPLPSPFL